MTDNSGCDPVPAWAKRIINGSATEADYQKALSVNAAAWNGSARYTVDEAISIAREHQSIMTAEHHKRGTTNKSNQQKHEKGQSRKQRDNNGEKGDARRKPNPNKRRPLSIQRMISLTIAVGATIGVIYLVANDITGVGIADDAAIAPLVPIILDNVGKAFS